MQNQTGRTAARRVQFEVDLSVHDLQEERALLLREHLEARLVGRLREEVIVGTGNLDDEPRGDLVTADIAILYR